MNIPVEARREIIRTFILPEAQHAVAIERLRAHALDILCHVYLKKDAMLRRAAELEPPVSNHNLYEVFEHAYPWLRAILIEGREQTDVAYNWVLNAKLKIQRRANGENIPLNDVALNVSEAFSAAERSEELFAHASELLERMETVIVDSE